LSRALFGTDGVRGVAGVDLTEDLARSLGAAAAGHARAAGGEGAVVIGRDTRESGPMLERGLVAGIVAAGGRALSAGVLPTPGVAVLARQLGADLGCVVSASHNPFRDNGIKFLGGDGRKLGDDVEASIESRVAPAPAPAVDGVAEPVPDAADRYAGWLAEAFGEGVRARGRLALDCANGAAVAVAPALFARLGLDVNLLGDRPDGRNINEGVGSTHLDAVAGAVRRGGLAGGIAFDGDADRCLAVDGAGRRVDGDAILAVLAIDAHARGELSGDLVVVTSMTNLGFHRLVRRHGIGVEVADVGDRYVLERMEATGAVLGGEQSGHVVHLGRHTTGDGIATALLLLGALDRLGMSLDDAATMIEPFPQRLVGVRADRAALPGAAAVWEAVARAEAELGEDGRVVLRASGTEPLVRVMVEAPDEERCRRLCDELVRVVTEEIGT
jgi:phosphoglucosamine mutase